MGFEKLIDLIVQFLEFFRFCTTIDCYQQGVCLRFGKMHRVMEPGFHWLLPFYIDNPIVENVKPKVHPLTSQSLVTKDDRSLGIGATITFTIRDIEKALLGVEDVRDALHDSCLATICEQVGCSTYAEVRAPEFSTPLTAACRKLAFKYGIEIISVRINELAPLRTYRLITGT